MEHFRQRLTRRLAGERGSMVVEFGLMLPLLVVLISGLVEFGMAYSLRMSLSHAAREGVRVYSLVDGGAWADAATGAAGSTPSGVPDVTVESSGNCPLPSAPPSPAVQSWVSVTRADYQIEVAFLPPITVDLTGKAVMQCGG